MLLVEMWAQTRAQALVGGRKLKLKRKCKHKRWPTTKCRHAPQTVYTRWRLTCLPTEMPQLVGAALDCVSVARLGSTSLALNRARFGCGSARCGLLVCASCLVTICSLMLRSACSGRRSNAATSACHRPMAAGIGTGPLNEGESMRRAVLARAYQSDRNGCGSARGCGFLRRWGAGRR